jgi:hypothetical protein
MNDAGSFPLDQSLQSSFAERIPGGAESPGEGSPNTSAANLIAMSCEFKHGVAAISQQSALGGEHNVFTTWSGGPVVVVR